MRMARAPAARSQRDQKGAPGRGHLGVEFVSGTHPPGRPQGAHGQHREDGGADRPEGDAQRVDGEQRSRTGGARGRVERVDARDAGPDGQPDPPTLAQRRPDSEK